MDGERLKVDDLVSYWIKKHNEHYSKYLTNYKEPRYELKTFFLNSYNFFKTLKEGWGDYLLGYQNIFKRDPSNDYYKYRDPTDKSQGRQNSLEWTTAFEILAEIGPPYNDSATRNFYNYSKEFLDKARAASPELEWGDFMLSSAVAHLPDKYPITKKSLPSGLEKYIELKHPGPHQLMIYLKALSKCNDQAEIQKQILSKLTSWIDNPEGTNQAQINVWARLITRMDWLPDLCDDGKKQKIIDNFSRTLGSVYGVYWSYSPMVLEAAFLISSDSQKAGIRKQLEEGLASSSFMGIQELFHFLVEDADALEVQESVRKVHEKCGVSSRAACKECMTNKKDDCWIRILAKVTDTEPQLHSGFEVADKVIYSLQQGIYVVVKAQEILKQTGEGDVLFRQCVSLFSVDHALILYLNPFETAPVVIEAIKKAAAASKTNPRFEVIDQKYVRQIYQKYLKL